ncbi:hypothetical protein MIS45_08945 [Wielerella bovis]|uniref:hypothetical protein n=1 Tax=Wielerella bovis TaxID=2917790 RepID=UPI002018D405|nr:hypothetical protein [Wielerella bovis]ULJ68892.1 hypothetical protein MIS45_08945 [Wielerella bovis]
MLYTVKLPETGKINAIIVHKMGFIPICMNASIPNPFHTIVAEFYQVFAYPKPAQRLNVCDCGRCVHPDFEREMRTLSLRELQKAHIYEYIRTVSLIGAVSLEAERPDEVRYFLPRMVELFTQGKELHHSIEVYFKRVGECVAHFTPTEMALWQRFCNEYLMALLSIYPYEKIDWKVKDIGNDLFNYVVMFHIGCADIQPFLAFWATQNTPQSTLNYVLNAYGEYWGERYHTYPPACSWHNEFANDYPELKIIMENWLNHPQHKAHFVNCLLDLSADEIQKYHDAYDKMGIWAYNSIDDLFDILTE